MQTFQTPEEVKIGKLKAALDQILNGSMIDKLNHNDDGLVGFGRHREVTEADLRKWRKIASDALKGY